MKSLNFDVDIYLFSMLKTHIKFLKALKKQGKLDKIVKLALKRKRI